MALSSRPSPAQPAQSSPVGPAQPQMYTFDLGLCLGLGLGTLTGGEGSLAKNEAGLPIGSDSRGQSPEALAAHFQSAALQAACQTDNTLLL